MSDIVIRPMELKDLDQVEEIERKSFTSVGQKVYTKKNYLKIISLTIL